MELDESVAGPVCGRILELSRAIADERVKQYDDSLAKELQANPGLAFLANVLPKESAADKAERILKQPETLILAIIAYLEEREARGLDKP